MKYLPIKEFRERGFLQEVNRQFLHPLGLALEIQVDDDGTESLGGIWDGTDDPEGIIFSHGVMDPDKVEGVKTHREERAEARMAGLGFVTQPPPKKD